jgi:hypothetical protein
MKKLLLLLTLVISANLGFSQGDFMTVLPDSSGKQLFSDYLGIRLWGSSFGLNSINEDLHFKYLSTSNGYVMTHNFDVRGINGSPNFGIGLEENAGQHFLIHFFDGSVGYTHFCWNWNIGAGAGYFIGLDKSGNLRLRASLELYYESISYGFGSYADTTGLGFVVNGNNIGATIQDVKYVNNGLLSSLGISLMFRTKELDFFAGVSWNDLLLNTESVNFYYTRVNLDNAVYTESGTPVSKNIITPGSYMLQFGLVREFGL